MQIVIDIPNWLYNAIMEWNEPHYSKSLGDAVRDGIPLPKGYGRLISEDDVLSVILLSGLFDKAKCGEVKEAMSKIPTILAEEVQDD